MKKFLTLLMLVAPFISLTAAKESKEALVKREEPKEELVTKKKAAEKLVAPSRKIKIVSHTTSIAVPTIIFLMLLYFIIPNSVGVFGNEHVNNVFCSILSSVVGFYFYLYVEAFLAKKISSRFFSGLIAFLLSGCVEGFILCIYVGKFPINDLGIGLFYIVGLICSLNTSLLSCWVYTRINRFAERGKKEAEEPKEELVEKKEVEGREEELVTKKEAV